MNKIKQIPIPFCGVALGLAATGNLFQDTFPGIRMALGILALLILLLFLLKVLLFFKNFIEEMKNPVLASVSGTFSMACMLLSVYMKPFFPFGGKMVWFAAVACHIALILYFSMRFMRKLKPSQYHASFYIVYVGVAVASITAPAWAMQPMGKVIAVFAMMAFILLVFPVTMRYLKDPQVPAQMLPLFTISAAPASLCIVGFRNSFGNPWKTGLILLYVFGTVLYLPAVKMAITKVFDTFYPSFAAFTFPLVISAIATKTIISVLTEMDQAGSILLLGKILGIWLMFQKIMAVFMTLFVLSRFIAQLFLRHSEG